MGKPSVVLTISYFLLIFVTKYQSSAHHHSHCEIAPEIQKEIEGYQEVANKIIDYIVSGPYKGKLYSVLSNFTDAIGARLAGTPHFEEAVDYVLKLLKEQGLEDVHTENATVPHWERGKESCTLLTPRLKRLPMLGLYATVGTGPDGVTGEVFIVKTFDELKEKADQAKGKIVLFNHAFTTYAETSPYRYKCAIRASEAGAIAALVRTVASFSIGSPHTGTVHYQENVTKIPAAAITVEDAEMLQRIHERGQKITLELKMDAVNFPPVSSRNTITDMKGSTLPDEMVIVAAHLDSHDVGEGAMDDGGGAFLSWNVLKVLKEMGLKPKRTLRSIMFTAEETGTFGAAAYFKEHKDEIPKIQFTMESDSGTFKPIGLGFVGTNESLCIVHHIGKLLEKINATYAGIPAIGNEDTEFANEKGVPGVTLDTHNERYFWFHHTEGDTMTLEEPENLDLCLALWTVAAYVSADISFTFPKGVVKD